MQHWKKWIKYKTKTFCFNFPDGEERSHASDRADGVRGVVGAKEAENRSHTVGRHARAG